MNDNDCTSYLVYDIGGGGRGSDCAHSDGHHYCTLSAGHEGPHKTILSVEANTDTAPFQYEVSIVAEFK